MTNYDVTVAGVGGTAPADGFVDPQTIYQYMNAGSTPTSFTTSLAKARGNRRNRNIVMNLQNVGINEIVSVTVMGTPTADTAPTSVVYRVTVRDTLNEITTQDETNNNAPLVGEAAIKRAVARGLIYFETIMMEVYDPTTAALPAGQGQGGSYARSGPRIQSESVGYLYADFPTAEASVSIAAV